MNRTIGPVTGATTGAAALVGIVVWVLAYFFNIPVPTDVQSYATVIVVLVTGWLVKPPASDGKHTA